MTSAAMKGSEKDELTSTGTRGDFVELDSGNTTRPLPSVRVDGPFGAPAEDVFDCEVAILIGAGIGEHISHVVIVHFSVFWRFHSSGVTPFASILKHIWYRQKKGNIGSLRRVEFFWVCRDAPSFGWFQSLLQEVEAAQVDRELTYICYRAREIFLTLF
jgi:NADPH oxidase